MTLIARMGPCGTATGRPTVLAIRDKTVIHIRSQQVLGPPVCLGTPGWALMAEWAAAPPAAAPVIGAGHRSVCGPCVILMSWSCRVMLLVL